MRMPIVRGRRDDGVDLRAERGEAIRVAADGFVALDEAAQRPALVEDVAGEDLGRPDLVADAGGKIDGRIGFEVADDRALEQAQVASAPAFVGGRPLDVAFPAAADRKFVAGPGIALEARGERKPGAGGRQQIVVGRDRAVEVGIGDEAEILGDLGVVERAAESRVNPRAGRALSSNSAPRIRALPAFLISVRPLAPRKHSWILSQSSW